MDDAYRSSLDIKEETSFEKHDNFIKIKCTHFT